ncbi:hypothetical protein B5V46_11180 [Rhodovulum sp. MB263]|nr:hypothetical protein B5V46_11180 [Rhodovulum sp. MB263]
MILKARYEPFAARLCLTRGFPLPMMFLFMGDVLGRTALTTLAGCSMPGSAGRADHRRQAGAGRGPRPADAGAMRKDGLMEPRDRPLVVSTGLHAIGP